MPWVGVRWVGMRNASAVPVTVSPSLSWWSLLSLLLRNGEGTARHGTAWHGTVRHALMVQWLFPMANKHRLVVAGMARTVPPMWSFPPPSAGSSRRLGEAPRVDFEGQPVLCVEHAERGCRPPSIHAGDGPMQGGWAHVGGTGPCRQDGPMQGGMGPWRRDGSRRAKGCEGEEPGGGACSKRCAMEGMRNSRPGGCTPCRRGTPRSRSPGTGSGGHGSTA